MRCKLKGCESFFCYGIEIFPFKTAYIVIECLD